jgi:hypothetical protein
MFGRVLQGKREALRPKHTSTLNTANNLGLLYANQEKRKEAEEMYLRAAARVQRGAWGRSCQLVHTALNIMWGMGDLYMILQQK